MTAARYVTIWCDESTTAPRMNCGEWVEGDDAAQTRRNAKAMGWQVNVGSSDGKPRDFCPEHRHDRKPADEDPR